MSRPLTVSVVIPTYRAAAFLPEAIASVRAQTRPPAEVIVVDDASPDDTADVAASLGARVVRQEANRGPSAARNRGVALAAGDLVAFLDADDAWLPWHLELCAGALEAHPRAAVACTGAVAWSAPPPPRPASPPVVVSADATVDLLRDPFIPQAAAVVRRPAVAEAGWYDERFRYAEDFDLWLRIAARHTVARVCCAGLRRRPHPAQVSNAMLQMVEHGATFRLRAYREIARGADPARAARAAAALGEAFDRDLHSTWYRREALAFDHLLAAAAEVPGTDAMRRRWRRKRRYGWALWHALRSAKYAVLSGEPD
jgi:glycosyltransferase involved in cell wall biosynthesis